MRVFTVLGALLLLSIPGGNALTADDVVPTSAPRLPGSLILATADTPPFSSPDGTGLYDRTVRSALESLGVDLEIRRLPSLRGLVEASAGRIDGEYGRAAVVLDDFPDLVMVPTPLSEYAFVAVGLAESPTADRALPDTFEELVGWDVAFINGWKIFESNVSRYRSLTMVAEEEQLFAMLAAERVEVILYDRARAEVWAAAHPEIPIRIGSAPLSVRTMHLLLNSRHADIAPVIDAALSRVLQSNSYREWYAAAFGTEG